MGIVILLLALEEKISLPSIGRQEEGGRLLPRCRWLRKKARNFVRM